MSPICTYWAQQWRKKCVCVCVFLGIFRSGKFSLYKNWLLILPLRAGHLLILHPIKYTLSSNFMKLSKKVFLPVGSYNCTKNRLLESQAFLATPEATQTTPNDLLICIVFDGVDAFDAKISGHFNCLNIPIKWSQKRPKIRRSISSIFRLSPVTDLLLCFSNTKKWLMKVSV